MRGRGRIILLARTGTELDAKVQRWLDSERPDAPCFHAEMRVARPGFNRPAHAYVVLPADVIEPQPEAQHHGRQNTSD